MSAIVLLIGAAVWFAGLLSLDHAPRRTAQETISAVVVLAGPLAFIAWAILVQIP